MSRTYLAESKSSTITENNLDFPAKSRHAANSGLYSMKSIKNP